VIWSGRLRYNWEFEGKDEEMGEKENGGRWFFLKLIGCVEKKEEEIELNYNDSPSFFFFFFFFLFSFYLDEGNFVFISLYTGFFLPKKPTAMLSSF